MIAAPTVPLTALGYEPGGVMFCQLPISKSSHPATGDNELEARLEARLELELDAILEVLDEPRLLEAALDLELDPKLDACDDELSTEDELMLEIVMAELESAEAELLLEMDIAELKLLTRLEELCLEDVDWFDERLDVEALPTIELKDDWATGAVVSLFLSAPQAHKRTKLNPAKVRLMIFIGPPLMKVYGTDFRQS
jgi:hypothetical protein